MSTSNSHANLAQSLQLVQAAKQQAGQSIQDFWGQSKYANTTLDTSHHLAELHMAMVKAKNDNDTEAVNDLMNVRDKIISAQTGQNMMTGPTQAPQTTQVPPMTFHYILGNLRDVSRYGQISDFAAKTLGKVSDRMHDELVNLAPDVKDLSTQYDALKSAGRTIRAHMGDALSNSFAQQIPNATGNAMPQQIENAPANPFLQAKPL